MPAAACDPSGYLQMERVHYAALVAKSDFSSDTFTANDDHEHVVGSYAQHEMFDYERWLFAGLLIAPQATALEYGCGPGRMLRRLASRFHRVDGVDISPEVLEVAARRCASLSVPPRLWVTDGAGAPDNTTSQYDVALSVICLQHICVYSVRYRILESLFRALKPGGVLTFQMGYAPGHPNMVDYELDFVEATATNGVVDVGVLHPGEIAADLEGIGFAPGAFALTPTGPGDTHGGWIFVRAVKPGQGAAVARADPAIWATHGFAPLTRDDAAVSRARWAQRTHGVVGRRRHLHHRVAALEARLSALETTSEETYP